MTLRQVLSTALVFTAFSTAGAVTFPQEGGESPDSLSVPAVKKTKRGFERPKRVDREVMKTVFIPKGQWLLGGAAAYSEYNGDNLNFLVLKNIQGLGYTLNLTPCFGYFFKDNIAAGLRYAYSRTYLNVENFQVNLGEDFNINLQNLYLKEHEYEVSGFLRTYMSIGTNKIFGFFNEMRLTYGYSQGKNSTGSGTDYDGSYQTANSIQIGIAPGLTAFVTDFASVEVSIGIMGYDFEWRNQTTNQIETGDLHKFSGNFKINLFSLNIGLMFYL